MRLGLFLLGATALLAQAPSFDYYVVALSWAPEFCATAHGGRSELECDPRRHRGFVMHGLWPQVNSGQSPEFCGPARPVAGRIISFAIGAMPSAGLIQHEWKAHGTCSGLDPQTYFSNVVGAYQKIQKPQLAGTMSPREIEQRFAQANHADAGSFRAECRGGELSEVRACVSRDLQGGLKFVRCTQSAGECREASVQVRPIP